MSRIPLIRLLVLVILPICASSLHAQVSSVRIYTNPPGAAFYVDEQYYRTDVTLLWPANSKHFIRVDSTQDAPTSKTQYLSTGFTTNLGTPSSLMPITASPGLTFVELTFSVQYALTLSYYPCGADDSLCISKTAGRVLIAGKSYYSDAEVYFGAGISVTVEAYPSNGWIFTGWGLMPGVPSSSTFLWKFQLNQPQVLHPLFQTAQPIHIAVGTSPPGLQVLIDRTPVIAPINYEWGWGTDHEVGVIPVQRDPSNGRLMIFDSWSDGGVVNHNYHVNGGVNAPANLSAKFVPGASVSFLTNPPGLTLAVDGRTNWPSYSFSWAQGTAHTVSAPATQTDAQGHAYRFVSWSNGGPASQPYTVVLAPDDDRLTATYQPVAQLNISSVPSGITMQVDGAPCFTPCSIQRDVGANISLGAPAISPAGDGSRLVFQGWTDAASLSRTLVASTAAVTNLSANYQLQHQLSVGANPPEAVALNVNPASPDGFYDAQSAVTVSADVRDGYRFLGWTGDGSGVTRPLGVIMTAPKRISVMLDPVPFVTANGLKNAAGDTPEAIVAPGSVISIVGVNLAPAEERGPNSPLKQTLAGITARADGILLPLFYVSPGLINAQLPFEITEGKRSLTISVPGKPDLTVNFEVGRNAPGIFSNVLGDVPYAMASHDDGTPVSPERPARRGETITIFGTGVGPFLGNAPDGFALPLDPKFTLADAVEVVVNDAVLTPTYAGAAAQKVGVHAVSFLIGENLPTATNATLKVRSNGHESNTVILPLQ